MDTTGTAHGSRTGSVRGAGRGVILISSGESSGAVRSDGNSRVVVPGLPACTPAIVSAGAANGCGRAECSA